MARKRKADTIPGAHDPEKAERAERFRKWGEKVARAREIRQQWVRDYAVEEGERAFLGQHGGDYENAINHLAATIKTQRPSMFFSMPKFYVRPKPGKAQPAADRVAAIGEGVLEAIAQQDDNLECAGELALLQSFFRLGVLKVIYDPRMEPNPSKGEPVYEMADGKPVLGEDGEPKILTNPLDGTPVVEPDEVMTDEVYRWEWVDAANMLLPDEGPDPRKWTWLGEEVVVPLEDAKEDTRFPKAIREQFTSNKTSGGQRGRDTGRKSRESDVEMFEYVECYDLRRKTWYIWADGQTFDDFILEETIPAWMDNDPYALLRLGEPILGPEPSPWPVPVVKDWLPIQREYNIRRRQIMEGAKRSARKVFHFEGSFADEGEATKALQSPIDMESVKITSPQLVPQVQTDADLNPSIYKDIPNLISDWRILTGTTGARQANTEGDTATEASFAERAANLRDSDGQKLIVRWMAQAGRKMLQCVKKTLTLDLWIQLRQIDDKDVMEHITTTMGIPVEALEAIPGLKSALGPMVKARLAQQKWTAVTREQLIFEADVTVVPGSTRPKNLDVERRQWMEFLRVLGQAPQLALSRQLLGYTAERFDIHDDRLLDELTALAEKMIAVNAKQAGREQAGAPGGGANGMPPQAAAALSAMTGGAR